MSRTHYLITCRYCWVQEYTSDLAAWQKKSERCEICGQDEFEVKTLKHAHTNPFGYDEEPAAPASKPEPAKPVDRHAADIASLAKDAHLRTKFNESAPSEDLTPTADDYDPWID